jgi:hypothetical protein
MLKTKPEHPINRNLKNKKAYDQYGLRPSLTTPFFVRAKEICSMLEVDIKDVVQMVQPEYTPWITIMKVNIDTIMLALPKGSSIRIRAELQEILDANYLDYTQIYMDASPQVKTRRFDCQYLLQSLMLKPKQLTQLSR